MTTSVGPCETLQRSAVVLSESKASILSTWEARVRSTLPASAGESRSTLWDALPRFLTDLERLLKGKGDPDAELAKEHGVQRAEVTDYSIDQVLKEYMLLGDVLLEFLGGREPAPLLRRTLFDFVQSGMLHAAKSFMDSHAGRAESLRQRTERLARELAENRFKMKAILDSTPSIVYLKDREGRAVIVNKTFEDIFQVEAKDVIGRRDDQLFDGPTARAFRSNDLRVIETKSSIEVEEHVPFRDGWRTYLSVKAPVLDEDGEVVYICGVSTDITERKRAERMQDQFVNTLSHDLRTPLCAAQMAALLLQQEPSGERVDEYSSHIVRNIKRADRMIGDLLDVNLIRSGKHVPMHPQACDLRELLEEIHRDLAPSQSRLVHLDVVGNVAGRWCPSGLRRALENLIGNAIKYGTKDAMVRVRARASGETVRIGVHNEGQPIPKEFQGSLFSPFVRTVSARESGAKGWGLGLTLVKGVVEAHGGRVEVESEPELGTTFTVVLPLDSSPYMKDGA